MTYTEDVIQNAICKYLDMRKVCYWSVPNGGSRKGGAIEGARLKKTGVKSGVPDITVVYDGNNTVYQLVMISHARTPARGSSLLLSFLNKIKSNTL